MSDYNWEKVGEAIWNRRKDYDIWSYHDYETHTPVFAVMPVGKKPTNGGGYINVRALCERKGLTITYLNEE